MKNLLIVYHSQSGTNARLARAVATGAMREEGVAVRALRATEASTDDLLWAGAAIFGTAENFGYLSGGLTDFFARTFYPYLQHAPNRALSYAVFIGTGNDGRGALRQLERIVRGYPMTAVAEPVFVRGDIDDDALQRCEDLGLAVAAGLALGIF